MSRRWQFTGMTLSCIFLIVHGLQAQLVNARQYDTQVEELARVVALQLGTNEDFRAFVKQRALEKFDGDYNFLLNPVLQYPLPSGKRVFDLLVEAANQPEELISFIQSQAQLQLAVPLHCENWNLNYSPGVLAVPYNYEEHLSTHVGGFDRNGIALRVSTVTDPDVPYVVITRNERTDVSGQLLDVVQLGTGGPIDDDDDGGGGGDPGGGPTTGGATCYGEDGDWQYLKSIKVTNLNAIEHWINGAPEIRFIFKRPDNTGLVSGEIGVVLVPESRAAINNNWVYFNASLFRWFYEAQGYPQVGFCCIVNITEKDNGTWLVLPVNIGVGTQSGGSVGVSLTITITDKDEVIGSIPAYFEDCSLHLYNPGVLRYRMYR